jgi:hypothetical protein
MKQNYPILIILVISLLVGCFTLTEYGESWDDYSLQKYADYSLRTYNTWRTQGVMPITSNDLGNYGPSYVMLVSLGSHLLSDFFPVKPPDNRHLIYFITYLFGIWAFYELGKRWLTSSAAVYATLLFTTQPLFWGHAFINPKDTPFLVFFLLSLLFGFRMVDSIERLGQPQPTPRWLGILITIGVAVILGVFAPTSLIHAWIESLVLAAQSGGKNIVSLIASDINKVKPEVYIQKYFILFLQIRAIFFLLCISAFFIINRRFRAKHPAFTQSVHLSVLIAAILLGFTTSIRILGPFAGVIVSLYAFHKLGRRALAPLLVYALAAIAATYITWPYLWSNPIGHFIESLQTMSKYPWYGTVLFNGMEYSPTDLPTTYLPVLLAAQFTEPVWILFIAGMAVAVIKFKENRELIGLTGIWFILPVIGFIVMRTALYDNFRQIFFILPPVFLMAGLGLEYALKWLHQPRVKAGIVGMIILPGLIAGIRLHPYEYVYYNTLIKYPNDRYELDYWTISYRQATEYVNSVAPPNTNVMVIGPGQVVDLHIREDLTVLSDDEEVTEPFGYVISTTRYNFDVELYPDAEIVHTIERNGMFLTVIKKVKK